MNRSVAILTLLAATAAACSQDIQPPPVRNLNRPTDIAFACFGDLRLTGDDTPECDEEGECVRSAQPIESCRARFRGEAPSGQEEVQAPTLFGFVLQSGPGTVALVVASGGPKAVDDSDPLTPGKNSIPIGTLPVGIASDQSGCHMVTANAGTCDLSVLDVNSALGSPKHASISRVDVTSSGGLLVQAKPRDIASVPGAAEIGTQCPSSPTGLFYVAYPECNLVAAIDAATGEITAGIKFLPDGTQVIVDGTVSCPQQCGSGVMTTGGTTDAGPADAGVPDAGPPPPLDPIAGRPVALHISDDGSKLFIGSENQPAVIIADLDPTGVPAALRTIRLEGDVGVTSVNVTDVVQMGGDLGTLTGTAGPFQFVYAIATDSTIRVANIDTLRECDTQVDPRFLHDERDVSFLACMPVGGASTPPRRPGARGPGIEVVGVPTSVSFAEVESPDGQAPGTVAPTSMVGYFGFVTTTAGFVFIINVDDDNYPDFEDTDDPARAMMPLAIAHQVRDFVAARDEISANADGDTVCAFPPPDILFNGPRISEPPTQVLAPSLVAPEQRHQLPFMRQIACEQTATGEPVTIPVGELHFAAPLDQRELAFPDLSAVRNERWFFTWEGAVSIDQPGVAVDGPPVRGGFFERGGGEVALVDPSGPFCAIGTQPFDFVSIVGCDPSRGDAECGIGETCFVHPDSPANVAGGVCVDEQDKDRLSAACRDFMISRRRYTVRETLSDRLVLGERRRVLATSPLDGCESADQCVQMFEVERRLADPAHPIERTSLDPLEFEPTWACEADPTRAPGADRCVMTCASPDQCEDGFSCSHGYCVEAKLPPAECISSVQRYQVRVGDAFAAIGERTGFLHNRIIDEATGECIDDPLPNPLFVGRIPLRAPECTGSGLTVFDPNPCSEPVEHVEEIVPFEVDDGVCVADAPEIRTRTAPAIRYANPVFTFHIVDTETTGDLECRDDRAGQLPPHSGVYPGYQFNMDIQGGFFPMFVNGMEPAFPIESVEGPDGLIWVLDQGDENSATKGQIFTINPDEARASFAFETIQ